MALNDNDLLFINDSTDSNKAKSVKLSTLKENILEGSASDTYVEVAGDNMTGDLTLGDGTDDKITLDAAAGEITCQSNVRSNGFIQSRQTTGSDACWSGELNGNATSSILADGSITAAGSASIDGNIFAGYNTYPTTGVKLGSDGSITATGVAIANQFRTKPEGGGVISSRSVGGTAPIWRGGGAIFDPGDASTYTSQITADGSSEFKGDMGITVVEDAPNKNVLKVVGSTTDGSQGGTFVYKNDGACYWRDKNNADNVVFAANGSAEFKGEVLVSTGDGATKAGLGYGSAGLWVGDATSSDQSDAKIRLNSGGSATFGTGYKVGIRPFDGDTADQLYIDKTDGTRTFSVLGNGSATFAGGVDSNRYFRVTSTNDDYAPYRITNQAGDVTFDVSAGGAATFAGSVTATGYSMASLAQL